MAQEVENFANTSSDCIDSKESTRFADKITPHIFNLYASRATAHDFEIYAPDATFEDPLMSAHGVQQIKSSFYSLAKVVICPFEVFSESSIVEHKITENVLSSGKHEILIDTKQHYKFMGKDIDHVSLLKLDVEDGRVVRHEDRWDRKPLLNRETAELPVFGRALETARRGSMLATHGLMQFGKDPTN